jgi:type II secretory pathway pseudopilin PulG
MNPHDLSGAEAARGLEMKTHPARESGAAARRGERGYSLVALLALMTVLMIMMMAAAPSLRQQSQRERELEAIARGEQVAEAIRAYARYAGRLPTSMDELQEGVTPRGSTRKVQVLRASSARDPLSESGEWRLIKVNDRALIDFIRDLTRYTDGHLPPATNDAALAQVAQMPRVTGVLDIETVENSSGGGDDDSLTSAGPFVGVASRSRRDSVITYYGIDHHNGWVFTPYYR